MKHENESKSAFYQEYANMIAKRTESIRLTKENPFSEFQDVKLTDCRMVFDIFGEPHILWVLRA